MKNPINGKAIKLARLSRNMKQSDLAELTGISPMRLSKAESNIKRIKDDKIQILCEVLNYPESFFRQDPIIIYPPVSLEGGSSYTK